ncbi:MAG: EamA/RhaT family transporter, partial [Pseudomonadota bacterium]
IGFIGVAVILRPAGAEFSWPLLGPITGALLYSLAMILTRTKCQTEDYVSLAFALHIAFILCGVIGLAVTTLLVQPADVIAHMPFLTTGWVGMTPTDWGVMAGLGLLAMAFTLGVARAYQIAPPHIIATFDYGYVGFALLWGVVFFSEYPDAHAVLGMCLVVSAGLMVALGARKYHPPPAASPN